MNKITLTKFIEDITNVLNIPGKKQELLKLITNEDFTIENQRLAERFYKLISIDQKLKDFEENKIKEYKDDELSRKYDSLKKNLAKMQVLTFKSNKIPNISPNINKKYEIESILNEFSRNLGEKMTTVNEILEMTTKDDKMDDSKSNKDTPKDYREKQKKTFRDKYKKYKLKYLLLKNKR